MENEIQKNKLSEDLIAQVRTEMEKTKAENLNLVQKVNLSEKFIDELKQINKSSEKALA